MKFKNLLKLISINPYLIYHFFKYGIEDYYDFRSISDNVLRKLYIKNKLAKGKIPELEHFFLQISQEWRLRKVFKRNV